MKKITLLIISITFLFVGYKNLPDPMSAGAPECSTGAPDERHCANSGCHSEFPLNSGTANLSISIDGGITRYEQGKTYPVTVSITHPGTVRFGFQLTVLRNSDNTNAGTLQLVNTQRTQLQTGFGALAERRYVTYTYDGTNAVATGIGKWSFEWTAPETTAGAVTFYAASIAANNDGTDAGDYTYTKRVVLDATPISWSIFPTLSTSAFTIQNSGSVIEQLKIYSSGGELVYEKGNVDEGLLSIELLKPSGIYFLSVTQNGKTDIQKLVITR